MINTTVDRIVVKTQLLTLADILLYIANHQPSAEAIQGFIEGKREQLIQELKEQDEARQDSN